MGNLLTVRCLNGDVVTFDTEDVLCVRKRGKRRRRRTEVLLARRGCRGPLLSMILGKGAYNPMVAELVAETSPRCSGFNGNGNGGKE